MVNLFILIVLVLAAYCFYALYIQPKAVLKKFLSDKNNHIPLFEEIHTNFAHRISDHENTHSVMDVIDFEPFDDGTKALLVTGSTGQPNAVLVIENGIVNDRAHELGLGGLVNEATYGLAVGDIDNDGQLDIIMAQHSGIYIYSKAKGATCYTGRKLDIELPEHGVPVSIVLADTRKSGNLDMYICTYIDLKHNITANYNDPAGRVSNIFLQNDGDGTFTDKTEESGLMLHQNTFMGTFADLNGNGYPDLILALNTDRTRVYENNRDGTFKEHVLTDYGFWMGIAVGDSNNNGRPDIFLTNVGKSIPVFLLKGDLMPGQTFDPLFKLFRNDGDFNFTDISKEVGVDTNVFGWGATFADFTNNGRLDLVVTENYNHFPMNLQKYFPNPGKLMLQGVDGQFVRAEKQAGISNPYFGYRALAVDLDGNGYKDLVLGNLDGPLRIFLNQGGVNSEGTAQEVAAQ